MYSRYPTTGSVSVNAVQIIPIYEVVVSALSFVTTAGFDGSGAIDMTNSPEYGLLPNELIALNLYLYLLFAVTLVLTWWDILLSV